MKKRAVHFAAANSWNRFNWLSNVEGETPRTKINQCLTV